MSVVVRRTIAQNQLIPRYDNLPVNDTDPPAIHPIVPANSNSPIPPTP